jgi:hypothetical protein
MSNEKKRFKGLEKTGRQYRFKVGSPQKWITVPREFAVSDETADAWMQAYRGRGRAVITMHAVDCSSFKTERPGDCDSADCFCVAQGPEPNEDMAIRDSVDSLRPYLEYLRTSRP